MITYTNIQPKPYTQFGTLHTPQEKMNTYNADVDPQKSIRLYGTFRNHVKGPQVFDRTFSIGDWAEYDSYNISYNGIITAIGKNTVTIQPEHNCHKSKRLDLYTFSWRNWNFNLEKSRRDNTNYLD